LINKAIPPDFLFPIKIMPRTTYKTHSFTLTEVMVATIILAMSAAATMAIVGIAQANVYRAENRWNDQHITASVVEYYLLAGPSAAQPSDLMPDGYSSTCELLVVDDIHEDAQESIKEWQLGEFVITVNDARGNEISLTRIRKVLKEDDFE